MSIKISSSNNIGYFGVNVVNALSLETFQDYFKLQSSRSKILLALMTLNRTIAPHSNSLSLLASQIPP